MLTQRTNCKNCGAALDIWAPKCEFCGTRNINLTSLDLASGEPANFIFKLPSNIRIADKEGADVYLTTLAIPSLETIQMTCDTMDIYGGWNDTKLASYRCNNNLELALKLTTVHRTHNDRDVICELRYDT